MSRIAFVVAVGRNKVIGKGGGLPWALPDDLKHVRDITIGKPLIMGRRTYDSIGRPLPKRTNIVLTRDPSFRADGVRVAHSKDEALALAGDVPEVIVFGGGEIYRQFLDDVDRIYLTQVDASIDGDTYFDMGRDDWRVVSDKRHEADDRHMHAFNWITLDRVRKQ